ncbi:MAG: hypothetical protein ACE5Z5_11080 [Candidatus Bathyarchaeia archaeon]
MVRLKKRHRRILLVALLILGFAVLVVGVKPLALYSTAYEGSKGLFYGVHYNGKDYTASQTHGASQLRLLGTTMLFDPDDSQKGLPNLEGEMTSIFIPKTSIPSIPNWVPSDWRGDLSYINNPQHVYEWEKQGDGFTTYYRMEE